MKHNLVRWLAVALFMGMIRVSAQDATYTNQQIIDALGKHLKALPPFVPPQIATPTWEDADISGQCFIVTKGGENVKLGLVTVRIYDPKTMQAFTDYAYKWSNLVTRAATLISANAPTEESLDLVRQLYVLQSKVFDQAPDALVSTKTDADGKFVIKKLPKGDFYLFAFVTRQTGLDTETYIWKLKASEVRGQTQLFLSSDNHQ